MIAEGRFYDIGDLISFHIKSCVHKFLWQIAVLVKGIDHLRIFIVTLRQGVEILTVLQPLQHRGCS